MTGADGRMCGCKGIRSCLLCEPGRATTAGTGEQSEELYVYCPHCEKAWPVDTETGSASAHQNHTPGSGLDFPGITVLNDFVTKDEEQTIVTEIDHTHWAMSQSGRKKQDYGPKVNFKKKKLKLDCFQGLPPFSKLLVKRINHSSCPVLRDFHAVELCNLEYEPSRGSAIDAHFDDFWLWGERLVTINLLSDTVLTFSHPERPAVSVRVPLPARSLLVVYGAARYEWQHAIKREDITSRRLAVTLRELTAEFTGENAPRAELGEKLLEIASRYDGRAVGT